jgi:hypothetical protein
MIMKRLLIIAAALALMTTAADAHMRHDRVCDIAQERVDPTTYNPEGGNAVMFGKCETTIEDIPIGDSASRHDFWSALSCGYRAYRQGKRLKDSPYQNREMTDAWRDGWKFARKSCMTGRLPTFNASDIQ